MKKTLNITIDGINIFAEEGTTILEAAKSKGIEIPTLCYHPRLEPMGHCRICIVQVEGFERPMTSCDNPIFEGMSVTTDTPKIREMRNQILEFALATHPYKDCLTCVRTGTCELQEKAYCFQSKLPEQISRKVPVEKTADNPYIVKDEEKCILCGRCIQVCRTNTGRFVYEMIGNGVNTRVVPTNNGVESSLEDAGCIFCGQCIEVCPVAAITEKERFAGGREWELKNVPGICVECSLGCYLERQLSDGNLIKVTVPAEGDKVSWLCKKGKFGLVDHQNEKKATVPIKIDDGKKIEISYDEAIRAIADRLSALKETNNNGKIAVYTDGRLSCEEYYLLHRFSRNVLETEYIFPGLEPAWVEAYTKLREIAGIGVNNPTPFNIRNAEAVMIIGSGLEDSHPVADMAVRQAARYGNAGIVCITSEPEKFSAWNKNVIAVDQGHETDILVAMSAVLKGEEISKAAERAGIAESYLITALELMKNKKSVIIATPSFFKSADSLAVNALLDLAESGRQIEKGRSNLLLLSSAVNAIGIFETGLLPVGKKEKTEKVESRVISTQTLEEEIKDGKIAGLLLLGEEFKLANDLNPGFLAVITANEAEYAKYADYIIPGRLIIEKDGFFVNASNQVRFNEAAWEPESVIVEGWKIIADLARAMGVKWSYNSLKDVREEMENLVSAG
ncbi:MAG: molybdopterin-dependent oxidoreductase [Bacillota bacterium]|nr:molybdopterin-dependent oxidoreductase [Bacillota bacterium]